jgi:hypothetical protein
MKRSGFGPRKKPMSRGSWKSSTSAATLKRRSTMKSRAKKPTVAEGSKYLAACRGESCYLRVPGICRLNPLDDTIVPCHENSLAAGKGMGLKSNHARTVPGCFWCHAWLDQGPAPRVEKRSVFLPAFDKWAPVRARDGYHGGSRVQPVKVEINLPMPAALHKRWSSGRFISERIKQQVRVMAYGFRRCPALDASGKEYIVHVLADVPSGYRSFVRRDQWVTDKLAWVEALIALSINAAAFAPFFASGAREWRAEVAA